MIVKNTREEITLLNRCLDSLKGAYDEAFVTVTDESGKVAAKIKHPVTLSFTKWEGDFAKARNFNWSQVPESYDFVMWSDADDVWLNAQAIPETLTEHKCDGLEMMYAYDHDEWGNCTVAHRKTMVIRNGSAEWVGRLHENLIPKRELNVPLATEIKRVHRPNAEHSAEAMVRNEEISRKEYEEHGDDPRNAWNYANSLIGVGKGREAIEIFERFVDETGSPEEEYVAYLRMGEAHLSLNDRKSAIRMFRVAVGLRPQYPDAYLRLAQVHFDMNQMDESIFYAANVLAMKPDYEHIAVYNPRDYDYNPLMLLSKAYYKKGNYRTALEMLKAVQKIVPEDQAIANYISEMQAEYDNFDSVSDFVDKIMEIKDEDERRKAILEIPEQFESHPKVCIVRNTHFVKKESSGKDVYFYCGMTTHAWNSVMAKTKGVGGSEESVINLSKRFAQKGYNVTVFANIGQRDDIVEEGVTWKQWWKFNSRDVVDVLYVWRSPAPADFELGAKKIIVDMHDVIQDGEFTKERLKKIHKVMLKSHYHRSLYPSIPDDKVAIVPNGYELPESKFEKDPMLIVNTSSPDRSLSSLARNFKKIKEIVPEAKCEWAYGWEIFDNAHAGNPKMMAWKAQVVKDMEEAGIVNRGRLSQDEVAQMYHRAKVFAYPSVFPEICCISLTKAQAAGAIPVTTSFGVFKEKNQYGFMAHTLTVQGYEYGRFDFGLDNPKIEQEWVEYVVSILQGKAGTNVGDMKEWAHENYNWDHITDLYEKSI